ncbi:uncharacterized protein BDZ99DRAFT_523484 [Mytilinidion resinicola]|uniref:Heterokaryon incompatibility domain-containing protein n=1 Tax=Mytilinidion resinicola TaxID=574789 RepID=A0A6A6YDN3_9PEZI|nr:uncharacterized protein BDZ99DRAFT_523484 [Mytilinidion resinicola]KAF2806926.1 hypothetical protein BDZ99DRAFT_523484 [Mytilinidion resinicola]
MRRSNEKTSSESEESEEELKEYKYTNLEKPSSIRLLKLRPGGWRSGEVLCDLVEDDLDWHDPEKADKSKNKKTDYEALSWNWGTLPWDRKIRVSHKGEDYYQLVPPSFEAALRALRDRRNSRVLWVDAICIYSDRSSIKYLRNLRSFIQRPEEPNRDPRSTGGMIKVAVGDCPPAENWKTNVVSPVGDRWYWRWWKS